MYTRILLFGKYIDIDIVWGGRGDQGGLSGVVRRAILEGEEIKGGHFGR